ncbi:glycerate kinase [Thalassobacillus devorans]|uniref:Glycerate kinase n=1 Tax=Thalassobacillus devorans TaxID=279813 RepID=A0ABQ1NUK4_9BACI|nr:glycerate kinase [Thalassobacillus devorans]NIK28682.1 glycerate kinase [Thalassobacillus devorans]GGC84354.1 glycerate kinase [Thalassobacillus devorans]
MNIVISTDSFKGSVSSIEAARHLEKGIKYVVPDADTTVIPVADGGEGTVEAFLEVLDGEKFYRTVQDPLGRSITATFGWVEKEKLAIIEMAAASGLPLLREEEKSPEIASTYGTGELIREALDFGAKKIILGIGGSATVDAGTGCFQALGVKFLDKGGYEVQEGGGNLGNIKTIDLSGLDSRLKQVDFVVASDVNNPLLGENGAVAVFGPQKGVSSDKINLFEQGFANYADAVEHMLGEELTSIPGSGAAGGFGFSLKAFLSVEMHSGLELIAELSRLEEHIQRADFVFTGEGKIDDQSLSGKVPVGVGRIARKYNVPVIAFTGSFEGEAQVLRDEGITVIIPIVDKPMPLKDAIKYGGELLERSAQRVMNLVNIQSHPYKKMNQD